jgi:hypothetical protein
MDRVVSRSTYTRLGRVSVNRTVCYSRSISRRCTALVLHNDAALHHRALEYGSASKLEMRYDL